MNYLVEIKNEYTITLVNILTPLIYQGIDSIYKDSKKISNNDNTLKNFQIFLRAVPKWNNDLIENETNRILSNCRCADWINDLIKAVIKSNIIILTNNSSFKKSSKIDISYYEEIDINNFIHKIYIECAREIWNNPYLFFDEYQPIELKRNQRDTLVLIKESIKEAIRKMLPVKHILKEYLGNNFTKETHDDFEYSVSEANEKNIKNMLQYDITDLNKQNQASFDTNDNKASFDINDNKASFDINDNKASFDINDNKLDINTINKKNSPIDINDFSATSIDDPTQKKEEGGETKVFEINKSVQLGGQLDELKNMNKEDLINQLKEEEKRESTKKSSYAQSSENITTLTPNKNKIKKIKPDDDKIKSILENELYNNVSDESDTSISYTHGNFNDESFEDIFSNINGEKKSNSNSKNDITSIASEIFLNNLLEENNTPKNKKKKKSKEEYFSKYMKV